MTFIEKLQLLERIDILIRKKATGSPSKLARRLDMAESTLYEYIKVMKVLGAKIIYDKNRQSYRYEEEYEFKFGFFKRQSSACYGGKESKDSFALLLSFSKNNLHPFLEEYQEGQFI